MADPNALRVTRLTDDDGTPVVRAELAYTVRDPMTGRFHVALIDAADYDRLLTERPDTVLAWGNHHSGRCYLRAYSNKSPYYLDRVTDLILAPQLGDTVSHLNGNSADVRRSNLKVTKR
jgi:hypothetical protein